MTHRRRLAAKSIIVTDRYASGNPHHRYEQVIFPDHIVMSQMHQIIQFCPIAHDGAANRRSVDTGIAADFHIVAQYHITGLLHFIMLSVIGDKTEPVTADDTAGLQDIPVADDAVFPHGNVGIDHTVTADFYMTAYVRMGINHRIIPDFRTGFHYRKRLYCNVFPNAGIFRHVSQRADHTGYLFPGAEQFQQFGKSLLGITDPDDRPIQFPVFRSQYHSTGPAFMAELHVRRYGK